MAGHMPDWTGPRTQFTRPDVRRTGRSPRRPPGRLPTWDARDQSDGPTVARGAPGARFATALDVG